MKWFLCAVVNLEMLPWVLLALLAASSWINPDVPDSLGVVLPEPGSTSRCWTWTSQSCAQTFSDWHFTPSWLLSKTNHSNSSGRLWGVWLLNNFCILPSPEPGEWLQWFIVLLRLGKSHPGWAFHAQGTARNYISLSFIFMLGNVFECCGF